MYQATPRSLLRVVIKLGAALLAATVVVGLINRLVIHDAAPGTFAVLSTVAGFAFVVALVTLGVGIYRSRKSADQ